MSLNSKPIKEKITHTADCLLGICDDWKYTDIKEHLDWLIANPNEIAEGYPKEVINEKYYLDILCEVKKLLFKKEIGLTN